MVIFRWSIDCSPEQGNLLAQAEIMFNLFNMLQVVKVKSPLTAILNKEFFPQIYICAFKVNPRFNIYSQALQVSQSNFSLTDGLYVKVSIALFSWRM